MNVFNLSRRYFLTVTVILASIYVSYYPLFHGSAWWGHDATVHINRLYSTLNMIESGQFPPYFDSNFLNYPGHSWNLFYPPLYGAVSSLFQWLFGDYNLTVKLVSFCIFFISFYAAFYLFRQQRKSTEECLLLATCYACSLYLVDNIFVRFSLPESFALAFFPLLYAGLQTPNSKQAIRLLTVVNSFIILSNIPASISVVLFLIVYFLFNSKDHEKMVVVVKSYALSFILCAWFIVPLVFSLYQSSFSITNGNFFHYMSMKSINLIDFVVGSYRHQEPMKDMVIGLGFPLFFAFVYSVVKANSVKQQHNLIVCVLIAFITIPANYDFLPKIFDTFSLIQFSWRLIPFTIILVLWEINRSGKLDTPRLCLVVMFTSLITSSISVTKGRSMDLNAISQSFKVTEYADYALKDSINKKGLIHPKLLTCFTGEFQQLTVPYQRHINEDGLPSFTFELLEPANCTIPFLAYNPLTLSGVNSYQREGFFQADLSRGEHIIDVSVKPIFNTLLIVSMLISLCVFILTFSGKFWQRLLDFNPYNTLFHKFRRRKL